MRILYISATLVFLLFFLTTKSQTEGFREKYSGSNGNKSINGVYFLSPSTGFAAFSDSLGYTVDSGHTFQKKAIIPANTNFNGYSVNLTFGFYVNGVYAFSQDSLLLYGDYGAEPSVLFSANRGDTWKVVYHQDFNLNPDPANSFTDLKFWNNTIGVAVNGKYILRTTNKGQSWAVQFQIPLSTTSQFAKLSLPSSTVAYAIAGNAIYRSPDKGITWSLTGPLPDLSGLNYNNLFFIYDSYGYIVNDANNAIYLSSDYGNTWTKKNDETIMPVPAADLKFINDSTGFATTKYSYNILKTTNSGKNWEVCKKNTSFQLNNFGMTNLFFLNNSIGWAAGKGQYLMITTSSGSPTLPRSLFIADTTNVMSTGNVKLNNLSRRNNIYQYKWFCNGILVSSSYNATYAHNILRLRDTLSLVVFNGIDSDTSYQYQNFNAPVLPAPVISSFTPTTGNNGTIVNIIGSGFQYVDSVTFGSIPVVSYIVNSPNSITAIVGAGTSGAVRVKTENGVSSLAGFVHTDPPLIYNFYPHESGPDGTVIITGVNFTNVSSLTFGGAAPLSYTVLSPTAIKAVVNTGNSGSIEITTPMGLANALGFFIKLPPVITSFSPLAGSAGSIVTITGSNFYNIRDSNIVFFGAVRATVLSASPNSLTVKVPYGASYDPITVTKSRLTGWSSKPFDITFYGGNTLLSPNAFKILPNLPADNQPKKPLLFDADGDGKADILGGLEAGLISAYKNVSGYDTLEFGSHINFQTGGSALPSYGDLNGDGKLDIMTANNTGGSTSILKNISTASNIILSTNVNYPLNHIVGDVASGDFNSDGRPDVAVANFDFSPDFNVVSVFTNVGVDDSILLAPKIDFTVGSGRKSICIADFDSDGKLDIATAAVSVLRNTSTLAMISFEPKKDYTVGGGSENITAADLNGDGKPDIITSNNGTNTISILRNNSVPDTIAFLAKQDIVVGAFPSGLAISDIDGDGRPDILVVLNPTNSINGERVAILKNIGNSSTISFAAPVLYYTPGAKYICVDDLDLDGKPDFVVNHGGGYYSLRRNIMGELSSLCAGGSTILTSSFTGTSYQWEVSIDSINFAPLVNGPNYSNVNTISIGLNNIPSSWYGYQYRCNVNGNYYEKFNIGFTNTWTGINSNAWENPGNWSCGTVPDINTQVFINSGTVILNVNTSIRSLILRSGVNFTVSPGVLFTILH